LYQVNAAPRFSRARLTEIEGPRVGRPVEALERWRALDGGQPSLIAGDGAGLYADDLAREAAGVIARPSVQLAGAIGLLAVDRVGEALEPSAVRPLYVRRPDAEVLRDEKRLRT